MPENPSLVKRELHTKLGTYFYDLGNAMCLLFLMQAICRQSMGQMQVVRQFDLVTDNSIKFYNVLGKYSIVLIHPFFFH